ncbi:hypothetical protein FOA43_003022 [Brettanomyces nanus]|uniref:Transcription regulator Rua1 C-terminal domain-containing protein n=1 Tax=Eeniella nana TaxID=13502 RepID=A0A875S9B9_EENNA|nr:uncharacterized protein FOA43_003022 [Brettanomyces nanus]QPG75664.1 hypothetical protein FOA43_003022 [Brettanomyces nanus]
MQTPETELTSTATDLDFYEPADIFGTNTILIPEIGSVFKQLADMNHSYNLYNTPLQQQHPSENEQEQDSNFESQGSPPPEPIAPPHITEGDMAQIEEAIFAEIQPEPNYIATSGSGQIQGLYENQSSEQFEQSNIIRQMNLISPITPLAAATQVNEMNQMAQIGTMVQSTLSPSDTKQENIQKESYKRRNVSQKKRIQVKESKRSKKSNKDFAATQYTFLGILPEKPVTPYNQLPYYRRANGLEYRNFSLLNGPQSLAIYERNKKFRTNLYEPAVNKKFTALPGQAIKSSNQGNFALCPYCELTTDNVANDCEKMYYKRNDSNYLHHMIQYHGIFSNGELVKDPEIRGWALTPTDKSPVEVVRCPYCEEFVNLKKFKRDNRNEHRLLKYLRHVKEKHKTGKNLEIMQRQRFDK